MLRSTKNQNTYLQRLLSYGKTLADSVKVDGQIKVLTVAQMRLHGKMIMELKNSLPHTRAEMIANAPRGIVKVSGSTLIQSIKNSTVAKIHSWDNMPAPEKDIYEEAAKKMKVIQLRKLLRSYYAGDTDIPPRISKMTRGESSQVPGCLLNLFVTYWKDRSMTPPEPENAVLQLDTAQKEALKISAIALREVLIEAFAGDSDKCEKIREAVRGDFSSPDSLVSMFYSLRSENSTS